MGTKGEKQTMGGSLSAEQLMKKLDPIGAISSKRMFGGYGIFHDGKMFCIVDSKGISYLKADESSSAEFEKMNCSRHSRMPYYSIPQDVLNNEEELIKWAEQSISISKS